MGKMYKKKQADEHGPPREHTDMQEQDMDIRKIMKDVENFSNFSSFIVLLNLLTVVNALKI